MTAHSPLIFHGATRAKFSLSCCSEHLSVQEFQWEVGILYCGHHQRQNREKDDGSRDKIYQLNSYPSNKTQESMNEPDWTGQFSFSSCPCSCCCCSWLKHNFLLVPHIIGQVELVKMTGFLSHLRHTCTAIAVCMNDAPKRLICPWSDRSKDRAGCDFYQTLLCFGSSSVAPENWGPHTSKEPGCEAQNRS